MRSLHLAQWAAMVLQGTRLICRLSAGWGVYYLRGSGPHLSRGSAGAQPAAGSLCSPCAASPAPSRGKAPMGGTQATTGSYTGWVIEISSISFCDQMLLLHFFIFAYRDSSLKQVLYGVVDFGRVDLLMSGWCCHVFTYCHNQWLDWDLECNSMLTAVCMTAKRDEILSISWYFLKILHSCSSNWGHRSLRVVLRSVSSSCSHPYGNWQCRGLSTKHCWCAKKEVVGIGSKEQELLCGSRVRVEQWCC